MPADDPCEHAFKPVPLEVGLCFCKKCNCTARRLLRRDGPPEFKVLKAKHKKRSERWIGRSGKRNPLFDHNDIQRTLPDRSGFIRTDKIRRGEK